MITLTQLLDLLLFLTLAINFRTGLALTPPSAAGARPAALSSLRSLLRGLRPLAEKNLIEVKFLQPKIFKGKNRRKILKKKSRKFWKIKSRKFWKKKSRNFFFSIFQNFFSVEIIYMMSRLRTQNFTIIGQGVPEIQGVTDTQTDKLF